jgi:hypothetical protein
MANSESYPLRNPEDTRWTATGEQVSDKMSEAASQAREKIAEVGAQAREMGRSAVEKLDQGRESAAEGLRSTADSLRSGAQTGTQGVTNLANRAADSMEQTAQYMREHDVRGMVGEMEKMVRRNPGPSLIAAAAVGFLLGTALRRD